MADGSDTPYRWFEREPSAATLDFHTTYTAQLRAKHPGLFSAPQPEALPPLAAPNPPSYHHPFIDIRERVAQGAYALRDPAASAAGLIPAASSGDCLAPVVEHGDITWFDGTATPQHGDIVAVIFTPATLEFITEFHRAKYGARAKTITPYAQKLLWNERGEWLLLTNVGSIPLAAATVAGTCRRVERNGVAFYA
jgi:hypothetical protein